MIVVGARPAMGKTGFLITLALNMALKIIDKYNLGISILYVVFYFITKNFYFPIILICKEYGICGYIFILINMIKINDILEKTLQNMQNAANSPYGFGGILFPNYSYL